MAPRRKQRPRPGAKKKGPAQAAKNRRLKGGGDDRSSYSDSQIGSSSQSRSDDEDDYDDSDGSSSAEPSDEDDPREYKHGGYHPVSPYQLYSARYRVLSKLGAGAFSTVWLCADEKDVGESGPELVAMKVCKSNKRVTEQALDEIDLLERLESSKTSSPHVVQMRGHFWHSGPNGRHKCMVFEVMGENLLALVKYHDYKGLPVDMVKRIARHTLRGLAYIHSRGVIHTDLKLENVLVQRHDLGEMQLEARRAFRSYMDTRASFEGMTKNQKKRAKKKEKLKNAKAQQEGGAEADEEATRSSAPAAAGAAASAGGGEEATRSAAPAAAGAAASAGGGEDGADDPDEAAAQACGRPVPPVRQRERFDTFGLDRCFAKLADFGNGVRSNKKVTDIIQTRQYRSPEIIIGQDWNETADNWSAACMFFELVTGDFLFDPHTGDDWSRDEDHLALMIELLGDHPKKEWATSGKYSRDFFNNNGKLKHIKSLKFWPLTDVLVEKYKMEPEDAAVFNDFLQPMLRWLPADRQQATDALHHPWLRPAEGEVDLSPCGSSAAAAPEEKAAAAGSEKVVPEASTPSTTASAATKSSSSSSAVQADSATSTQAATPFAPPARGAAAAAASAPGAEAASQASAEPSPEGAAAAADAPVEGAAVGAAGATAEAEEDGDEEGAAEGAGGGAKGKKKRNKNKKNKK